MTKILLVEDDKSLREIYGVRLLAEGYDIVSAGDGEEALAMAIKERPQLIVSDVMMPKISGFDMLDILRSTSETKDIKVIMMTALSSEDQRARGESLGADRYLVKSQVGIEDVVRTVHDVLGDSLAPPTSATQSFGVPAPSAVAQPVAPQPTPVVEPVAPVITPPVEVATPVTPFVAPQPVTAPQPIAYAPPVINTAPATPQPYPAPEVSQMPQPTAPFGSSRPGSLGDRIIHPLSDQQSVVDVGSLMNQELNAATSPTPPPIPPAPVAIDSLDSLAPPTPQAQ